METTAENTVCYPVEDHATMCPITFIDVMGEAEAKQYELPQYVGDYHVVRLGTDQALVYGKNVNSLPITSVRVESQPCADPLQVSSSTGTVALPNELSDLKLCERQQSTGFTQDGRFKKASNWEMTEGDIMRENGVFERLYKQDP